MAYISRCDVILAGILGHLILSSTTFIRNNGEGSGVINITCCNDTTGCDEITGSMINIACLDHISGCNDNMDECNNINGSIDITGGTNVTGSLNINGCPELTSNIDITGCTDITSGPINVTGCDDLTSASINISDCNNINCDNAGISWALLFILSVVVAFTTITQSGGVHWICQGIIAFIGSFLLNLSGNNLGSIVLYCAAASYSINLNKSLFLEYYTYSTGLIVALAALYLMIRFLSRKHPHATGLDTNLPDPEMILLGVFFQNIASKLFHWKFEWDLDMHAYCSDVEKRKLFWYELLGVSGVLAVFTFVKTTKRYNAPRSLCTFFSSFVIHLTLRGVGWWALACPRSPLYSSISSIIHGLAALILTVAFVKKNPVPREKPGLANQIIKPVAASNTPSQPVRRSFIPMENSPSQTAHPSQQSNNEPSYSGTPQVLQAVTALKEKTQTDK